MWHCFIYERYKTCWKISMVVTTFFFNLNFLYGSPLFLIDSRLPEYRQVAGVSGQLSVQGSELMANLFSVWAQDFQRYYPDVIISINAQGTSAVPPALIKHTLDFGLMSRKMNKREIWAFEAEYGYPPTRISIAKDVLIIYVNQYNPIQHLTLPQIDAIFSTTRRCGYPEDVLHWGQLGLTGTWKNTDIKAMGRNSASGSYDYFKEQVLCDGDFKTTVVQYAGGDDIVQSIAYSIYSIGYTGVDSETYGVKALPLATGEGEAYITPTKMNIQNGSYPLSRTFYLYVNKPPTQTLTLLQKEFLKMILSKTGQRDIAGMGYYPLALDAVQKELAQIK